MAAIRIIDFSGKVPLIGDRALPDNYGVEADNTSLYSKELIGVPEPQDLGVVVTTTQRVLRLPLGTVGGDPTYPTLVPPPSFLGDSFWLKFDDKDTDIVRSQLVNDSFERWYFCSPSTGPVFNTKARILASSATYKLGVPGPEVSGTTLYNPQIFAITGGTAPTVTRAFVYTWVNIYGEESAPSNPVVGTGNANATWTLQNLRDPNPLTIGTGWAPYDHKNIYRTVTGASGQTTYYKVGEIAIGVTVFDDNAAITTDAIAVGNLQLESVGWAPPPATLKGIIAMPNGYLIGFDGSDIYFSENYRFHAWPPAYKQASEYKVVGMGIVGQTCIVCTEGFPATITGARAAIASFTKATTGEPAMSRGSIVSTPDGVIYASQNGLILAGPAGVINVTEKIINRASWLKDFSPAKIRAVRFQNGYLALCDVTDPSGGGTLTNYGFFLDPSDLKVALTMLPALDGTVSLDIDRWSGECLFINGGKVYRYAPPVEGTQLPIRWKSKEFQLPQKTNFSCFSIYWDDTRYYDSLNWSPALMGHGVHVQFRVWADRTLIYDQTVPLNGQGVRLPSGFKSDIWQFEIRARAPVYSLHVAETMRELRDI